MYLPTDRIERATGVRPADAKEPEEGPRLMRGGGAVGGLNAFALLPRIVMPRPRRNTGPVVQVRESIGVILDNGAVYLPRPAILTRYVGWSAIEVLQQKVAVRDILAVSSRAGERERVAVKVPHEDVVESARRRGKEREQHIERSIVEACFRVPRSSVALDGIALALVVAIDADGLLEGGRREPTDLALARKLVVV